MIESCPEKQATCQEAMEKRFEKCTPWRTFTLVFGSLVVFIAGSYAFAWGCFMTSSVRATASEGRAEVTRTAVAVSDTRNEATNVTLADVKKMLAGIQSDVRLVEMAVNRMEAMSDRLNPGTGKKP